MEWRNSKPDDLALQGLRKKEVKMTVVEGDWSVEISIGFGALVEEVTLKGQ